MVVNPVIWYCILIHHTTGHCWLLLLTVWYRKNTLRAFLARYHSIVPPYSIHSYHNLQSSMQFAPNEGYYFIRNAAYAVRIKKSKKSDGEFTHTIIEDCMHDTYSGNLFPLERCLFPSDHCLVYKHEAIVYGLDDRNTATPMFGCALHCQTTKSEWKVGDIIHMRVPSMSGSQSNTTHVMLLLVVGLKHSNGGWNVLVRPEWYLPHHESAEGHPIFEISPRTLVTCAAMTCVPHTENSSIHVATARLSYMSLVREGASLSTHYVGVRMCLGVLIAQHGSNLEDYLRQAYLTYNIPVDANILLHRLRRNLGL
jgi:hypothetical protein